MKKTIAIVAVMVMTSVGCAWLSENVPKTIPEIARLVCLLAAKDRPAADRAVKDDECWCIEHAADYVEEVARAKAAGSKRAGLAVPEEAPGEPPDDQQESEAPDGGE